jgi:predicted phage terminase large subunit-like protein
VFTLTTDQNTKTRFENDKTGYRIATSVGGLGTGEGGDVIVVDDPHNVEEALSDVQREAALIWWGETMSTRLNDPKTGAKVIIMQRLHEGDLAGHVLERGGYEHLMIPMEYERDRHCATSLGWEDPRVREEELLWPSRFTPEAVATLKRDLGPYGTAGQLQQRPAPRGGGYFKEDWLRWYETPPKHVHKYGASDYAVTADGGDYTVHGVIGVDPDDNIYVLDWWREQTESDVWIEAVIDLMKKHEPLAWAEEAGQIVKSIGPFLRKRMRERKCYCLRRQYTSDRDKATRARSIEARMSMGMVYLPKNAPWKDDLVSELLHFPAGIHDDQVDVLSLVGRMLDRLVPGRVPKEPNPINLGQPTLDELLALQPKHNSEGLDRI